MPNFPGPYEIEYQLTGWATPAREHVLRVNISVVGNPAPGTLPTAITVQKMGGGTATLQAVADQFWSFIRLAYANTISCVGFQLWKYVPNTYAKDFISTGTVTTPAGASGGITIAGQMTLTFRSANGGILKVVLLESNISGDARLALVPNPAGTAYQRIASYIMSADNVLLARDDAFPVNPLRVSLGQNERTWREIYR